MNKLYGKIEEVQKERLNKDTKDDVEGMYKLWNLN